jgi:uncharacterized protein (TIGR01777 family)
MKIVVTGGTGLVGSALVPALTAAGHRVTVLTRSPQAGAPAELAWRPDGEPLPAGPARQALSEADAVVHLAGASLAGRRWTPSYREEIMRSRVLGTRTVVETLRRVSPRPSLLLSASAVGYYGDRGDEVLTEDAGPGQDFLAQVSTAWEKAAEEAQHVGVRVVCLRTGVVLDAREGALPALARPFRLYVGGPLGDGRQWLSWITKGDLVRLILFLLGTPDVAGPVNAVAPEPVPNAVFSRALAQALGRPSWLRLPAPVLRAALGEMAELLLLESQRAVPERLLTLGFPFEHRDIATAFASLFPSPHP